MTKGSTAIDGLRGLAGGAAAPVERTRPRSAASPFEHDLEDPDRPADVLDLLLAEILVADLEPVADLIAHRRGNADAARLRHRFEPRRHIDAVAEDIVVLHDHVAKIDADAIEQRPRRRHVAIAPRHALLKVDGAAQRFGDALEFDQHAVAGGLDDAALAFGDRRIDQLQPYRLQPSERSRFIDFHEPAVADDVRGEDRGKPALDIVDFHGSETHPSARTAHGEVQSRINQNFGPDTASRPAHA